MGGGIMSGLMWGTMTSVIVLGVASQMAPLPPEALQQATVLKPAAPERPGPAVGGEGRVVAALPDRAQSPAAGSSRPIGGAPEVDISSPAPRGVIASPERVARADGSASPTSPIAEPAPLSGSAAAPSVTAGTTPRTRADGVFALAEPAPSASGGDGGAARALRYKGEVAVTSPAVSSPSRGPSEAAAPRPPAAASPSASGQIVATARTGEAVAGTGAEGPLATAGGQGPLATAGAQTAVATAGAQRPVATTGDRTVADAAGGQPLGASTSEPVINFGGAPIASVGAGNSTPSVRAEASVRTAASQAVRGAVAPADRAANQAASGPVIDFGAPTVAGTASVVDPDAAARLPKSVATRTAMAAPDQGAVPQPERAQASPSAAARTAAPLPAPAQTASAQTAAAPSAAQATAPAAVSRPVSEPAPHIASNSGAVAPTEVPTRRDTAQSAPIQMAAAQTALTQPTAASADAPAQSQPQSQTLAQTQAPTQTGTRTGTVQMASAERAAVAPEATGARAEPTARAVPSDAAPRRRPEIPRSTPPTVSAEIGTDLVAADILPASRLEGAADGARPLGIGALRANALTVVDTVVAGSDARAGDLARTAVAPTRPRVAALIKARTDLETPVAMELPDPDLPNPDLPASDVPTPDLPALAAVDEALDDPTGAPVLAEAQAPSAPQTGADGDIDTAEAPTIPGPQGDAPQTQGDGAEVEIAQADTQPEPQAPAPRTPTVRRNTAGGFGVRVQPLTERSGQTQRIAVGRLPSIGASEPEPTPAAVEVEAPATTDAATALERHAAAFENPQSQPKFSIILIDAGAEGLDPDTIRDLDFPVTIALDPVAPGAAETARAYREAGIEVMLLAAGLPEGAAPQDIEVAVAGWMANVPEAVAVLDTDAGTVARSREVAQQISQALAGDGRGLVLYDKGLNSALGQAEDAGVAAGLAFRQLDASRERQTTIGRYLDRAAFKAAQEGQVIMVGHTYPETISALVTWALEGRGTTVALAPVSAILLDK